MGSPYLWAGPIGLLASLLVIALLAPVPRNSKRVELVEKKGLLSISRQKQLVARGRAMEMRRLTLLVAAAGEAEAEGPCVSWRGCQRESFYNNQTMNTSKAFYDRFDRCCSVSPS